MQPADKLRFLHGAHRGVDRASLSLRTVLERAFVPEMRSLVVEALDVAPQVLMNALLKLQQLGDARIDADIS